MAEDRLGSVCVFCGSKPGSDPAYTADAVVLGQALADRGVRLVYGGAQVGVMGAVADAALGSGGEVVGVIPRRMVANEVAHEGLTRLHVVGSMHERKALMAELADGFVAMPGGLGTLEELAEILTWSQLGLHTKPVGLLDRRGYFDHLLGFLDHAVEERFVKPEHRALLLEGDDAGSLLEAMDRWRAERASRDIGPGRHDNLWST